VSTRGLRKKSARGMAWTLAGALGTNVIRVAALAALGRLLAPEDFGVVATAMTVMVLVQSVRDIGVGGAIIQRKDLDRAEVASAFAFSMWLGVGLSIAMLIAAPLVGDAFDMPDAVPLLRVMSAMFVLKGLSTIPYTMCQREFKFRALTIIDLTAFTIGSAASVAFAAMGSGPWALVWGDLIEVALGVAALLYLRPPPWSFRVRWHDLRALLGFGAGYTVAQLANVVALQGDNAVVGRRLGKSALGYYSRAYDLVRFPSMVFTSVVGSVMFPAFAKLQDDPARLGLAFRRTLFATAVVLLPASAGLVVLAPEVIRIVIGPQWTSAVLPFQIMAATMLFRTSYKVGAIVARSAGDVIGTVISQATYAVLVIGGAIIGARWGIHGVATSTAAAVFVNFFMLTTVGKRFTTLRWRDILAAHVEGAVAAALVIATAGPVAWFLREAGAPLAIIVIATVIAGAIGPLAMAWAGVRRAGSDWAWVWETIAAGIARKQAPKKPTGEPPMEAPPTTDGPVV
jgi:O-antigen/teichoic acid export membrane protein